MEMDLNNRLTEDETLEQAYDIFLELAADNLDRRTSFFSTCSLKSVAVQNCSIPARTGRSMWISI